MDDEEFELSKGSLLKELRAEDLDGHSMEALEKRIAVLKSEIDRAEAMIASKKDAKSLAEGFFKT